METFSIHVNLYRLLLKTPLWPPPDKCLFPIYSVLCLPAPTSVSITLRYLRQELNWNTSQYHPCFIESHSSHPEIIPGKKISCLNTCIYYNYQYPTVSWVVSDCHSRRRGWSLADSVPFPPITSFTLEHWICHKDITSDSEKTISLLQMQTTVRTRWSACSGVCL